MGNVLIPIDTGRRKPYLLEITHHEAALHGLPEALHGATFVHVSDFHAGFGNTDPVYEEAICRINALAPDYLLFTGDYIDDHAGNDYPLPELLCRFRARYGTYATFGNHDHRRGVDATRRMLEQSGIRVLNNESVRTEQGLWIAGVDDYYEGEPDNERALKNVPDDVTALLLSHNPSTIDFVPNRDVLILSGHTHGGQIVLPFPPPRMVVKIHLHCNQVAGWYANGRARLYVSRGLGVTGRPFRYRCPAEIGVFRLVPQMPSFSGRETSHCWGIESGTPSGGRP